GDPLVRIESMKVETQVMAPAAGIVREVLAPMNGQVDSGAPLLRLEPLAGESEPRSQHASEPLSLARAPPVEANTPRERYIDVLAQLRTLLLGFDVPAIETQKLGARWRVLAAEAPADDPELLREEDWALGAFADIHSLFSRARAAEL